MDDELYRGVIVGHVYVFTPEFQVFVVVVFFFFFQAEDGIRDIGVTGVQTCALPILRTSVFC